MQLLSEVSHETVVWNKLGNLSEYSIGLHEAHHFISWMEKTRCSSSDFITKCILSYYRQVLEENCIQDLMFAAVHAQRTGTKSMASRLRKVTWCCFTNKIIQMNKCTTYYTQVILFTVATTYFKSSLDWIFNYCHCVEKKDNNPKSTWCIEFSIRSILCVFFNMWHIGVRWFT